MVYFLLNRGTPKSSIWIGFSTINYPFWDTPIVGKPPELFRTNQPPASPHIPSHPLTTPVPQSLLLDYSWLVLQAQRRRTSRVFHRATPWCQRMQRILSRNLSLSMYLMHKSKKKHVYVFMNLYVSRLYHNLTIISCNMYMYTYLSIYLSIYLIYLSIYLSIYGVFLPHPYSTMDGSFNLNKALRIYRRTLQLSHTTSAIFLKVVLGWQSDTANGELAKSKTPFRRPSSKEVGKQSSELRTNRIVRLYSMKGGVWVYIT